MPYTDRTLTCVECGTEFTFSAEDQEYHDSRGFSDPRRCPSCRQLRRDASGGRPNMRSGGGGGGGGYSSAPRQMYPAVCAECGQATEVPFEPRTDRPVYCRTCFARRQGTTSRGGGRY